MTQNEAAGLRSEFLTIIDFWVMKLRKEMGGRMTVTGTDGHSETGTELKF